MVDSASLIRRKYLGTSDLAEIFWRKPRYFLSIFGKSNFIFDNLIYDHHLCNAEFFLKNKQKINIYYHIYHILSTNIKQKVLLEEN